MTRKDYKLIAGVLNHAIKNWEGFDQERPEEVVSMIAKTLSSQLIQDNPRFDRAKFLDACGVK
jgi:hypothetical protein